MADDKEFYSGTYPNWVYENCKAGNHELTGDLEDACVYCMLDLTKKEKSWLKKIIQNIPSLIVTPE